MRVWVAIAGLLLILGMSAPTPALAQQAQAGSRGVVKKTLPTYPDIARRMQLSGVVKVEVVVHPNGTTKLCRVIGGSPLLARAATDAIENWKWASAPHETKELVELTFQPR